MSSFSLPSLFSLLQLGLDCAFLDLEMKAMRLRVFEAIFEAIIHGWLDEGMLAGYGLEKRPCRYCILF